MNVLFEGAEFEGFRERSLWLVWDAATAQRSRMATSERNQTELAACGIACAVLSAYSNLRIRHVALDGDRFDYWGSDGESEYGLEVSGTVSGDVQAPHRMKVRQLRENPYQVDGYVIVVGFSLRVVLFSFHRFDENPS